MIGFRRPGMVLARAREMAKALPAQPTPGQPTPEPPPPQINMQRQPPPMESGGAWGGMLPPSSGGPQVPGLADQVQTSDQQAALQSRGSAWDRMGRGRGSLSGGMQPTGGI